LDLMCEPATSGMGVSLFRFTILVSERSSIGVERTSGLTINSWLNV